MSQSPTQPTVTTIATQQLAIEYHPQTIVENQPLINNQSDEEFNNTFTDANEEEEEIIPLNAKGKVQVRCPDCRQLCEKIKGLAIHKSRAHPEILKNAVEL